MLADTDEEEGEDDIPSGSQKAKLRSIMATDDGVDAATDDDDAKQFGRRRSFHRHR